MYTALHYLYFGIFGLVILVILGVRESGQRFVRSIPLSAFERANIRQRWTFLIAGIALMGGIAFVNALFNFAAWRKEEYFQKNSIAAEAVILESYRGSVSYENGFTVYCSDDVVYSFWVGNKEYTQGFPRLMRVMRAGDRVPIRYLRGHPEVVEFQGLEPQRDFAPLIWFGVCGVLAMVAYKKREEYATPGEGEVEPEYYEPEDSGPSFAPALYNPENIARPVKTIQEEIPLNPLPHEQRV